MSKARVSGRLVLFLGLCAVIFGFFYFELFEFFDFDYLKSQQEKFSGFYLQHKWQTISLFFLIYVVTTSLSLPGAAILTLVGGGLFGLGLGTVIVSFASTIGATCAFLASRYLFGEWVQERFGNRLKTINEGIAKEGAFYLFALRMVPIFPFFIVNLLMGLTKMRAWPFAWVSQIGMIPGTLAYVNAGTRLAMLKSPKGIIAPEMILAFLLLAILPFVGKKIIKLIRKDSTT